MTSVSTLGQSQFVLSEIQQIEAQMDQLSAQVSSGSKSSTFSGISSDAALSIQLTNAQTQVQGYLNNINSANTLITPMQTVLSQITDIVNQVMSDAVTASSDALPTTQGNAALQAEAQNALSQISALLNTRVGSTYLFGGQITSAPPMASYGSTSDASSILGQVADLAASQPLTNDPNSGDQLYSAIQSLLNNGITATTANGATVLAPFGYTGQTAIPGGTGAAFTIASGAAANATSITVSQSADLPAPGQFIQFQTIPPQNASYQVTSVVGRTINFQRVPPAAGTNPVAGLDFAVPAGTAISVTSPTAVTTVQSSNPSSPTLTGSTVPGLSGTAYASGTTTITVPDSGDYEVGQTIQFSNDPNSQYQITGISGGTLTIGQIVGGNITGNGLVTAIPATGETDIALVANGTVGAFGSAGIAATSLRVQNVQNYAVGDRVDFGGAYYDVTAVDPATQTITFVQSGTDGGGLTGAVTAGSGAVGAAATILKGTPAGSTVINVGSTTGVSAGMAVQFGNSSAVYTVTRVISPTQIEITLQGTSSGVGLQDPLPAPLPGGAGAAPGTDITASFGVSPSPLSAQIDNGLSLQYGISADNPAFRTVLGALFALATTNLNTTTAGGFREIASRAAADLKAGSQQVTTLASTLGIKQNTLTDTQARLQNVQTTLATQLSNIDDADMATAISQLTQLQTQLQASFQVLATMKDLTLANYL